MTPQQYRLYIRDQFIHAELAPRFEISLQNIQPLWIDILSLSAETGKQRVLVECDSPHRRLSPRDTYKIGSLIAGLQRQRMRIALCYYSFKPDELSKFFCEIAGERGGAVSFFSDLTEAMQWLSG